MSNINNERIFDYKIEINKLSDADGGGFLATVPQLPGCMSDGETQNEALENIKDAIICWIETAKELGREIPIPDQYRSEDQFSGKLSLRIPKSLHKTISEQAEKEGCSINQLITTYISIGIGKEFGKNQTYVNLELDSSTLEKIVNLAWNEWNKYSPNQSNRIQDLHFEYLK